jgi:hypothetical protein
MFNRCRTHHHAGAGSELNICARMLACWERKKPENTFPAQCKQRLQIGRE